MQRFFYVTVLLGTALLTACDDDAEVCPNYVLTARVDVQKTNGGDVTLYYDASGLIHATDGPWMEGRKYFYDASHTLIRVEEGQDTLLFTYDDKHRLKSIHQERFIDSVVFFYDEADRIVNTQIFYVNQDIWYYFDIEYTNATTINKYTYFRDPVTLAFRHSQTTTFTIDENPRPYPREYYLYMLHEKDVVLPHNPLSIDYYTDGVLGFKQKFTYTYNGGGFPLSENDTFKYAYVCN